MKLARHYFLAALLQGAVFALAPPVVSGHVQSDLSLGIESEASI